MRGDSHSWHVLSVNEVGHHLLAITTKGPEQQHRAQPSPGTHRSLLSLSGGSEVICLKAQRHISKQDRKPTAGRQLPGWELRDRC